MAPPQAEPPPCQPHGQAIAASGEAGRQQADRQIADELGDEPVDRPVEQVEQAAELLQPALVVAPRRSCRRRNSARSRTRR
jgi:hypothetical protein